MADGGDADFLAGAHQCADHARAGVGLAGAGRALDGEDAGVHGLDDAFGGVDDGFVFTAQWDRCAVLREGRAAEQEVAGSAVGAGCVHGVVAHPFGEALQGVFQRAGADNAVAEDANGMFVGGGAGLFDVDGAGGVIERFEGADPQFAGVQLGVAAQIAVLARKR